MRTKSNSVFYNSEIYYDSTAGLALKNLIQEEKGRHNKSTRIIRHNSDTPKTERRLESPSIESFCLAFTRFYNGTFGLKSNGKKKKFGDYNIVYDYISIYKHLKTEREVERALCEQGDMGKLFRCYKSWLETGAIMWSTGGRK